MDDAPVVDTALGRARGLRAPGVSRFLGLPYAAPPVGALRLCSPRAALPWAGVRDATRPGPASLQGPPGHHAWLNGDIGPASEDCLFANVWTPGLGGRAPVLLWLHGGQTRHGHGAAPAVDGSALARRGLVVVTINYRLGALGGLAHPMLADESTGHFANWGLQDMLCALDWVHEHIAAFGGDPRCVTLAGQSSGAANVALIAQHGLAPGRYARAAMLSPPLFREPMYAGLEAAAEYTQAFADAMGLGVPELRGRDGAALQRTEQAFATSPALQARMGRPRTAPTLDGRLLHRWCHDAPPAGVPVLYGVTRSESDFWFGLRDGSGQPIAPLRPPRTQEEFLQRAAALIRQHYAFDGAPTVEQVASRYGAADPQQAWRALYTGLVFRAPVVHALRRHARAGGRAFGFEFAHPIPSAEGGTPHAADVPFLFGTWRDAHFARTVGDAPSVAATSEAMMGALVAFARDGDPGTAAGCAWPAFDADRPALLRFGAEGQALVAEDDARCRDCWPAYIC